MHIPTTNMLCTYAYKWIYLILYTYIHLIYLPRRKQREKKWC